jgi:ubiquinone/menaquinone biosynthesis C-methylase UbiE
LEPVDFGHPDFPEFWDELSLWSAPFGAVMLDRVPVRAGMTIVDVGAGTGFVTIELAQRCGPDSRVVAVDPWREGLDRLARKIAYYGLTNIDLMGCAIEDAVLDDASVDLVVSSLGLNNFEDTAEVLAVCRRILRHDGLLSLSTNFSGHMAEFYDVFRSVLVDADLMDAVAALDAHIAHRGTFEELRTLLEAARFAVVDRHSSSVRFRYADGSAFLRHWFVRLAFLQDWKAVIPEPDHGRVFVEIEDRLNAMARRDGEFTVSVPVDYVAARPT